MPLQSWTKRANQRGAGMIVFRPDPPHHTHDGWHLIDTHLGRKPMEFKAGIDVWFDADRQRWNAEFAGDLKWRYVEPCSAPAIQPSKNPRARAAAGNAGRDEDRGAGERTAAVVALRNHQGPAEAETPGRSAALGDRQTARAAAR